ncbi:SRPBCC family protein [Cytobacillus sp. FJAT-53684]|uniref:SRPBCC family protein n=1 Tax=Cytobacillus mangrovibacter TaxID=3299024 RepID=A0ABW6K161_9BACI
MLALLKKEKNGYTAIFDRFLNHSVEQVWAMLTENEKLSTWFSELKIEELREGGLIKFDMGDGSFEKMEISEVKSYSVLEYTWGNDRVRFELEEAREGCRLILIEKIKEITNHTPKDLAGWHVCLDVIDQLLNGQSNSFRKEEWGKWYEQYIKVVEAVGHE